ncbi:ATP-binding protein [Caulobacter sp. Root1455]|uniref:ATP-binding protein n=1 Tax=Caulobacter sp. Root1455 TaxID=1736465 RepID=UPI000A6BF52A|nr:ATP-binding protein [Caulobacter sp. Root1455]
MARAGKKFMVDTSPTKAVVVNSLTRDATVEACIFDLIDNAIDAAGATSRHALLEDLPNELLESYLGYEISLSFSGKSFKIEDNCGGISVAALQGMALRFGQRSSHEGGIGVFGVGLNRALFKLGAVSTLTTDTGSSGAAFKLDVATYLEAAGWQLDAEERPSSGKPGTIIEVLQPPSDISRDFADSDWVAKIRSEIGQRYGRFIAKGLSLKVNGKLAKAAPVLIREDGPVDKEYKLYKDHGVSIHVSYGQHPDYRFTNEAGYDRAKNASLTPEFGWTVLCNDRAILVADTSWKTGWDNFHTEFYGFVGIVEFVSKDANKLPWHTTKTDVDLNNSAYQLALADMRKFAEKWRQFADKRKKGSAKGEKLRPIPPPTPPSAPPSKPLSPQKPNGTKGAPNPPAPTIKPAKKQDHNQSRMVLPQDVDEKHCFDKHLALVHEAKTLDLGIHTYAGLALIRLLFEASVRTYTIRHGHADALKAFAIEQRNTARGTPLTPKQEAEVSGKMEEMLLYLQKTPSIWGTGKAPFIRPSLAKMVKHMPLINGVMHNPFQPVNRTVAFDIRDEILPVMRHVIEN